MALSRIARRAIPKPAKRGPKPRRRIPRGKRPARVRQRDNRGALREVADDMMSLFVRVRGGWVCQRCGSRKWEEMQCAHIVRKGSYGAGRFRDDNAICLCAPCHVFFTHHEIEWEEWLVSWMGTGVLKTGASPLEWLKDVCRVRHGPHDYRLIILDYSQRLKIREDFWKVLERFELLERRAARLGVTV